ncbi:MAG: NnrS family protein [Deltaproteobacteria bacterium]|nr:NnrS family protein [Deltaproteobacteria bacterium]
MSLIQISKKDAGGGVSPLRQVLSITVIDKFFLIGAAAGLFGSLVLGIYVWFMRAGIFTVDGRYHSIRWLHAFTQFYLFMTPFILGFLIQSAPKLFETGKALPKAVHLILPVTICAAVISLLAPDMILGPVLISICCWGLALGFLPNFLSSAAIVKLRFGTPVIVGLLSLGAGVFLDLGVPINALLLFWQGIVSIILATGQQFLAGVLGGRRATPKACGSMLVLFAACAAAIVGIKNGWEGFDKAAAILASLTLLTFLYSTAAWSLLTRLKQPLALAFFYAHIWALIGAAMLWNTWNADAALHAWGIGFAFTLIIGVSLRLIEWLTDKSPLAGPAALILLSLWQFVASVRTFDSLYGFSHEVLWIGASAALIVLASWASSLATCAFPLIYKQAKILLRTTAKQRA